MKVLCMFMGLASAGLVACSSSEHATPTANDGGTSSSGWGDAAVGGNPCYIPTVSGQNFIGNPNFVSTDRSPDVVLGFQWQLQAYNEMMNRLQDVSEGTGSAPGDRMYNACKKLAADLGATGNQIAKTSDEPTPADKIKKICDLALDYVRTSTDILPETLNFATKLKCVTRMADIAECVKATKGADPVCIGPEGAKVPIVNGECVDGYLATSDACTVLAAAKMRCVDDLGGEQTVYFSAPSGTGKNNQPALDFMASLPFFFPANKTVTVTQADVLERGLPYFQGAVDFGPPGLQPPCSKRFAEQARTQTASFLAMQAFAKSARLRLGQR